VNLDMTLRTAVSVASCGQPFAILIPDGDQESEGVGLGELD
jgi:hypothetical protein